MIGRGLPLDCKAAVFDVLGRTRVTLYAEHICVSVFEGADFPAQRFDLFYAPAELSLGGGLA
jgi:hypothetical protein